MAVICPIDRVIIHSDVITFPATKSAAAATITGDAKYDYESYAFGKSEVLVRATDDSKITDTLTIKLYISYDGGTTWLNIADYSDLANGSGDPVEAIKTPASYVPRLRLDAVFDGTGALAAGHGCGVDVRLEEDNAYIPRKIFADVGGLGATLANSTTVNGTSCYIPSTIDVLKKVVVASYCADASKVTDNVTWKVQSSYDATNWFDASAAQTNIANGSGVIFGELAVETKLGKYVRVVTTSDGTGALASGHGVQFNVIGYY